MIDIKDLLPSITQDFVIELMKENGSDLYERTIDNKTRQECLWFRTICHGGNSHKLCYFSESKDFFCYTSCGKMSFFEFIKTIRNATNETFYKDVVLYIANKLKYKDSSFKRGITLAFSKEVVQDFRDIEESIEIVENSEKYKDVNEISTFYDEKILNYFENKYYEGWINEGIKIKTMKKYNIKWYEFGNCIIIPHYDEQGRLIGIRRRSFNEEDSKKKYMPLYLQDTLYDHPLALNLYGLNNNFEAIQRQGKVVFVEGEKSVLLSDSFFGENSIAVATCGFNISEHQINLISDYVNEVYIGFDKDFDLRKENIYKMNPNVYKEFLRYKNRLESLAKKFVGRNVVKTIYDTHGLLQEKDSPFDRGKDTFLKLMQNATVYKEKKPDKKGIKR